MERIKKDIKKPPNLGGFSLESFYFSDKIIMYLIILS